MTLLASRFPEKGLSEFGVCNSCLIPETPKVANDLSSTSVNLHNCLDNWVRTTNMLFKLAWLLLCVLPLVALCAEDYYKVTFR
jgi:hypothetical protein